MSWLSWLKGTSEASVPGEEAPQWHTFERAVGMMKDRQSSRWQKGADEANAWIRRFGEAGYRMLLEKYEKGDETEHRAASVAFSRMLAGEFEKPEAWDLASVLTLAASRGDTLLYSVPKAQYDMLLPIVVEALASHRAGDLTPYTLLTLLPEMRNVPDFGKKAEPALPTLRALAARRDSWAEDCAKHVRMIEESLEIATLPADAAPPAEARRCAKCGKPVRPFAQPAGHWSGTVAEAMALPDIEPDHAFVCEKCGAAVCPVCSGRRAGELGVRAFVCTSCGHLPLKSIYRA